MMTHWLRVRVQRWLELDQIPNDMLGIERRLQERLTPIRQDVAQLAAELARQKGRSPVGDQWRDAAIDPHLGQN